MPGWLVMTAGPRCRCGWPFGSLWPGQAVGDARMGVPCRPRCYPGRDRGRALGRRPPAAGPGRVGRRCWLRADCVGPWHRSATRAEVDKNIQQNRDLLAKLGKLPPGASATARTPALTARQRSRYAGYDAALSVVGMVFKVRYDLRHPRRLTVNAIASETIDTVFYVLRAARAVQRRRPRTAAGSALAAAAAVARLRAASAEPLR